MKITIIESNRKTMALHVRDGEVFARVPIGMPKEIVTSFIASKEDWIQKHIERYRPFGYEPGYPMRIFGHEYPVQIIESKRFICRCINGVFELGYPQSMPLETIQKKIDDTYKQELLRILDLWVPLYAEALRLDEPKFKIRRYKRLHGRCSSKGDLAFNTYLYQEPLEFIKYVALHECAHLIEFNHSARFYALIENIMPHYKAVIRDNKLRID
ncbi:M48 family metallopeptidase [Erysipelothrix sp. HDW6C]|uniref:M48 family metallopeptidase n=1 Tax=Erysipelothrix sp. HDW6C TaxID=2714930 RepID=UPI001409BD2C|nr:SprT family zinc-dependent metalloprotease [Erysipelothrix sp. HDW6C]QIK70234.1 M48 family metallopeptidase [Erysipelothrix sp. HDW6C]